MSKKHHILIIDHTHELLLDGLQEYDVHYRPDITVEELPEMLSDVTILILRSKLQLTKYWIDLAPNLQYIGRLGSGMDNIDVAYAKEKRIECQNAPEGNRNAVAEQTLGMILSLLSNVPKAAKQLSRGVWDRMGNEGIELEDLTVGIIGYGHVGTRVAELLQPFGCTVVAYDRYISGYSTQLVEEVSMRELMQRADIVTLHTPLNAYSEKMINAAFIEQMTKPFYLLNLSRGKVVVIIDLINGLTNGKVKGVGLDVLPNEDLASFTKEEHDDLMYLSSNERVMMTPHVGGITVNAYKKLANVLLSKVLIWIKN